MSSPKQATVAMAQYESSPDGVDAGMEAALRDFVPGSPEEKRLLRKIDLYLMPILWITYVFNYIDRTNIVSDPIAHSGANGTALLTRIFPV